MLVNAGILVNVSYSITPYNVDDMEEIFKFCQELNVPINPTAYMFPPARKNEKCGKVKPDRLTPELAGRARYMSEKYKFSAEQFALRKEAVKNREMVSHSVEECDAREPDEKMGCMAGRASFWVTWDGRMTPCGMMTAPVTYPFENDFNDEWHKLNKAVNDIYLPPACRDCEKRKLCGVCAALATAETGESSTRPEYLCHMIDNYCKFMQED
jgi:radical SAM protein with 4Fe4S-binding SPASM domain